MASGAYVIGVDVGGTNTDAVILQGSHVVAWSKRPTSEDRTSGIIAAIRATLEQARGHTGDHGVADKVVRVSIGTTHFVNAVVERARDKLARVGVIRLCGPSSRALPPFSDFPSDLRELVCGQVKMVSGGLEYDGREIAPLDPEELSKVTCELLAADPPLKNVVISGVFSPRDKPKDSQEQQAAEIVQKESPDISCTISSRLGMLGLIERENAAILNESLKPLAKETVAAFKAALTELGLKCPFFLTQNDGTLISAEEAVQCPVLTFSSGPVNSMRGATFLSGLKDAIVVDIGGTSTDVGVLCQGFPREASSQVTVGGVRTNFQMPDVPSIALGGGSIVKEDASGEVTIGPMSVGYKLTSKALCFGHDTCTTTDLAVAAGVAKGVCSPPEGFLSLLSPALVYRGMILIHQMLEDIIDQVKVERRDVPVVLVGGGSVLVDTALPLKGVSKLVIPKYSQVANAVGAALGMVSGICETVEKLSTVEASLQMPQLSKEELSKKAREVIVQRGKERAFAEVKRKGAVPGTEYVHEQVVSEVTYVPDALRVHVKVIGSLSDNVEPSESSLSVSSKEHKEQKPEGAEQADNPFWPYSSEQEKLQDESCGLPSPTIDKESGEWLLSPEDVECLSVGAGILGCGGGGDPNLGRTMALALLASGKKIRLTNPYRIDSKLFGRAVPVAFMGAPVILSEKLEGGRELEQCVRVVQQILATGMCEETNDFGRKETAGVALLTREVSNGNKIWLPNLSQLPSVEINGSQIPLDRRVTALVCAEVGGLNSIQPLITGARLGLPVLDCDGMGRAFPELQMYLPFVQGIQAFPSCTASEKGECVAVSYVKDAKDLEEFFRVECVRMGMASGVGISSLTLPQVLSSCVLFSMSRAWQLGRAILRARKNHSNVVTTVVEQQQGMLLFGGKVCDVDRSSAHGFTGSLVSVEGLGQFTGHTIRVTAKNENLLAQQLLPDGSVGKLLACTPDLIAVIDSDTGYPITTEDVRYGMRVSVLALPCYPAWKTPSGLAVTGPEAFGCDLQYQPPCPFPLDTC